MKFVDPRPLNFWRSFVIYKCKEKVKLKNITTMNSIVFMPSVMPHCGGGGDVEGFITMILTMLIVGIILYVFGILANILHIKFSNGFAYTPICWHDIKPGELSNTMLGWMGGLFGFAFIGAAVLIGLIAGIYWIIVTL